MPSAHGLRSADRLCHPHPHHRRKKPNSQNVLCIRPDKAIGSRTVLHVGKINHPVFGSISLIQRLKISRRNQIGFSGIGSPLPMPSAQGAPISRVRLPSPSTSPAEDTETPDSSRHPPDKTIGSRTILHVGKINHPVFGSISLIQAYKISRRNQIGFSGIDSPLPCRLPYGLRSAGRPAIPIHITGGRDRMADAVKCIAPTKR